MVSRDFGIHYNPEAPFDGEEDQHLMSKPPNDSGWWLTVLLVLLVTVVILSFVVYAFGHDKDRPELDTWFEGLANSNSTPCCAHTEANSVDDVDWDTFRGEDGSIHYLVRIQGEWVKVDDYAVIKAPNRYGRTVVWFNYVDGKLWVKCFLPGSGA